MDIYLIPLIGALIGWGTNFIAVKMLFHPRKRLNFILFSVQGVFPKRQAVLAERLGQIVARELFSADDIKEIIAKELQSDEVLQIIEQRVEQGLLRRLSSDFPLLAMMLNTEMIETIKQSFRKELAPLLTSLLDYLEGKLDSSLDVSKVVEDKVANFSSDKLEEILFSIMKKEFRFIEIVGGVVGFLIGCVQVALVRNLSELEAAVSGLIGFIK